MTNRDAYQIITGDQDKRKTVAKWLYGLEKLSNKTRENVITAWVSTWVSSTHNRLEDMPWEKANAVYKLYAHVNEVTRAGLKFAEFANSEWGREIDIEILLPILMLHDVDKPLMYELVDSKIKYSDLYTEIPHGVVGGMLLKELGFPHVVVSTVAMHSPRMPFHGRTFEACILSYADLFCCDNTLLKSGQKPFYLFQGLLDSIPAQG